MQVILINPDQIQHMLIRRAAHFPTDIRGARYDYYDAHDARDQA
jgi:hypothetical protein